MTTSETLAPEPPSAPRLLASRAHTLVLIGVMLGIAWLGAAGSGKVSAAPERSHLGQYGALFAMEWLLFYVTWRGLRRAGTPMAEVIGERWRALRDVWKVVLAAAAFYLAKQLLL